MATAYESNLSCGLCLDLYDDPRVLACGHSYCFKCLLDLQNKRSSKGIIKCPICQAESNCEYGGHASYIKNYDLNNLVQSCILKSKANDTTDLIFKRQKVNEAEKRNMYCNDCDTLITVADINSHAKHEVVSLDKASSIFKVKLLEATGNIELMQSTLKTSFDKSKEKLHFVEGIFEEIQLEVTRKKMEIVSKLKSDVKDAEASIDHVMSAISTHRELQSRTDTISFIEECQNILRSTSLKQDFSDVRMQLDKIDSLTCRNDGLLEKIRTLELKTNGPAITNVSNFINGRRKNNAILECTPVQYAESYNVFYKVKESTVKVVSTSDTSCVLDGVDVEAIELWVTAMVNGRESLPSASVVVPIVTLPSLQFDHQRAGEYIRVSTDGKKMTYADHAAELLGDHHPQCKDNMKYGNVVLGNLRLTAGRLYWEVEAAHAAGDMCAFRFTVMSSATPEDCHIDDIATWAAYIKCDNATTTVIMIHAGRQLHVEESYVTNGHVTHRYGLLLDVDQRSLSVIDVNSNKCIYVFTSVDTSHGVTPAFVSWDDKCTLHLVDPDEIQRAPLLPFSTAAV